MYDWMADDSPIVSQVNLKNTWTKSQQINKNARTRILHIYRTPLCLKGKHSCLHYIDIIMSAMSSQIASLTIVYSTVYSRRRSKKTSKLRVTGLCGRNSPLTGGFPAQRASNAEIFPFDDVIMYDINIQSFIVYYYRFERLNIYNSIRIKPLQHRTIWIASTRLVGCTGDWVTFILFHVAKRYRNIYLMCVCRNSVDIHENIYILSFVYNPNNIYICVCI